MNIRTLNTGELNLLFQLFDYNDPDEMIAENTVDINERKIDIFGLFQEDRLIGEIRAAYVHNDERHAVRNKRVYLFAFRIHKDFQGGDGFYAGAEITYPDFEIGISVLQVCRYVRKLFFKSFGIVFQRVDIRVV